MTDLHLRCGSTVPGGSTSSSAVSSSSFFCGNQLANREGSTWNELASGRAERQKRSSRRCVNGCGRQQNVGTTGSMNARVINGLPGEVGRRIECSRKSALCGVA